MKMAHFLIVSFLLHSFVTVAQDDTDGDGTFTEDTKEVKEEVVEENVDNNSYLKDKKVDQKKLKHAKKEKKKQKMAKKSKHKKAKKIVAKQKKAKKKKKS